MPMWELWFQTLSTRRVSKRDQQYQHGSSLKKNVNGPRKPCTYPTVVNVTVMKYTASVTDQFSTPRVYIVTPKK
jgi:hypothetical protein